MEQIRFNMERPAEEVLDRLAAIERYLDFAALSNDSSVAAQETVKDQFDRLDSIVITADNVRDHQHVTKLVILLVSILDRADLLSLLRIGHIERAARALL